MKQVSEILDQVGQAADTASKVKVLQQNVGSRALVEMLRMNFNQDVKWLLPEGTPPFKRVEQTPDGMGDTNLTMELRRMYIWTDPARAPTNKTRRETLFIELLEGLHWKEAEIVCLVKDHKLQSKYKFLTKALVATAFPGLIPETKKTETKEQQ